MHTSCFNCSKETCHSNKNKTKQKKQKQINSQTELKTERTFAFFYGVPNITKKHHTDNQIMCTQIFETTN